MKDHELVGRLEQHRGLLLDQLYQTVLDSSAWDGFLRQLVDVTGSRSARLLVLDDQAQRVHYSTKVNIDDGDHRAYVDHFVNACPWRPELQHKAPERLYSTALDFSCPQNEFYRTEFYNDWARHLDIHHGMLGTVFRDQRYRVQLLVQRTRDQGPFSRFCTETVGGLLPHVQQALRLSRGLADERRQGRTALAAAERSSLPFAVLGGQCDIRYLSASAQRVLENLPGARIRENRLGFEPPGLQRRFRAMLEPLLCPGVFPQRSGSTLEIPRGHGQPIRLFATVLEEGVCECPFWPDAGRVVLYIQDPMEEIDIDQALLAQLHGLSSAEARVAALVARSYKPGEISEQIGSSLHTVRTQLKAVFRKTDTHRQSELAALVLQSPAVVERGTQAPPVRLGVEGSQG